jgi:Holliday junction DNA helicase RuvA
LITGITGTLEATGQDWVQVKVGGGVSIQIFVPASAILELGDIGEVVRLHTRLYIRDDEAVLYGFTTPDALRLFQMLTGVSGIGPRTSLAILSTLGTQSLINAVATEDLSTLSKVPGVGRKSAGRLVLELKSRLEKEQTEAPVLPAGIVADGEVVSALMALGYSAAESRRVVTSMNDADNPPLEEKIRRALQQIGGR